MFEDLVLKTRSYRAFDESAPITEQDMRELVDLARRTASAMNRQPLRYRIVSAPEELELMYANTRYAAALSIKLPPEGQRPTGFILMFTDSEAAAPIPPRSRTWALPRRPFCWVPPKRALADAWWAASTRHA